MDIKYEIEPIFQIEFFKIKCVYFKRKKEQILDSLKKYAFREKRFKNFNSNRHKSNKVIIKPNVEISLEHDLQEIFKDEFNLIREKFNSQINVYNAWSVTYGKGDFHVPHNHGSSGYCGILYLNMDKKSPVTTYIQPWNTEEDKTKLYKPPVKEGDIVIVPQFLYHYTEPNKIKFKKRIISFDFKLNL
mgnify:CR=1 FL=1|tara:strand:- start:59 stop:622 length:564 start_codon:yes stop_codon:yes gene_type:complete